jgi:hypothetical protein
VVLLWLPTAIPDPGRADPPDWWMITLLGAFALLSVGAPMGTWLLAANASQTPRILLRSVCMAVVLAPVAKVVSGSGGTRLVVLPFFWAVADSLDGGRLSSAPFLSLLICSVLLSAAALSIARSRVSDTAMTVLALSVPFLPVASLLPCLFLPSLSPMIWAGEATMGWSIYLLLVTRTAQMASPGRLWALRAWLLTCAGAGAVIMFYAIVAISAWANHIT